jgi:hypothetical protein
VTSKRRCLRTSNRCSRRFRSLPFLQKEEHRPQSSGGTVMIARSHGSERHGNWKSRSFQKRK